jgi:hypothetical protein
LFHRPRNAKAIKPNNNSTKNADAMGNKLVVLSMAETVVTIAAPITINMPMTEEVVPAMCGVNVKSGVWDG